MTQRLRRILIMIVMALLTVTLMAASLLCSVTYARYAGGKFNEKESIYDQIIEFVGANQYEVYSPEELVEAIENGYSYIKIGKGAEEPFVITTGVTDVTANLVIDLNGTTIVRNSRNPVLDVQRNVSAVLVYDSTVENDPNAQPGSFYNPVGSALQVSGGTLTVAAGRYDSGPKDGIADAFTAGNATSFKLFKRNGSRAAARDYTAVSGDSTQGQVTMPALTEDVYLSETWKAENSTYNSTYIKADTYLIYSLEQNCYVNGEGTLIVNAVKDENGSFVGDALAVPCNAASCDFYYYYPIDEDGNPIKTDGTASAPQTYAVIYGYNDVKALAANDALDGTDLSENGLVWPYAAVRSIRSTETVQEGEGRTTGGEGFMRGGAFSTYFGTENTYGIYAEGGTLSVADGVSFTAVGEGVCIRSQTSSTTTDSNAAASLEISGGTFSSQLGDTIQMEGGSVTITGGAFVKDASSAPNNRDNNGSAIDIQGGTLKVNADDTTVNRDVTFTVTGDHVNGIKMTKTETATQSDTISNATFNFNPLQQGADSSLAGGSSVAAIQVIGGSLNVSGSNFNFNTGSTGTSSANNGIYVQGGEVNASSCNFNFSLNEAGAATGSVTGSAGIASVGGEVTATNCTFTLPGYSNYGIYATGGETTVTGGSITMTGDSNHGVFASGGSTLVQGGSINMATQADPGNDNFGIEISDGTVTANGCAITVYGTYSAGVLAQGGTVNLGGTTGTTTITVTNSQTTETENYQTISTLTSSAVSSEGGTINLSGTVEIKSDSLGITARGIINVGDETTQAAANVTVNTENATGVYVNNGTLNVNAGATLGVTSTVRSNTKWVQPPEGQTEIPPSIYNGVYVNGGSLNSTGTLNVDFTGVQSDNVGSGDNAFLSSNPSDIGDRAYREFIVKGYAVRVEGDDSTKVSIAAGEITNDVGGGVLVSGGTVVLGQGTSGPTVSATGTEHYGTSYRPSDSSESNWNYYVPSSGGEAVKIVGGGLLVLGGTYTAAQGNGILVNGGESYINGGTFESADGDRTVAGAGASYAFKVLNGTATVYGGTFGMPSKSGSGAFVSGSPASGSTAAIYATANIYGGSFVVSDDNIGNGDSGGQAGFSVLKYANVYFTETLPTTGISLPFGVSGTVADVAIVARGCAAGIAIEKTNSLSVSNATIVIDGGTYQGTRDYGGTDSVWYGNATTKLTIKSGTFTGSYRSGLYIDGDPNSNIQISGGTFGGNSGAFSGSSLGSVTTNEIMTSGARCYYRYYNNDYMICNSNGNAIGGNGNVSVALSDGVYYSWGTSVNYVEAFNTLGTIVVQ